jgi:hypothetical protein
MGSRRSPSGIGVKGHTTGMLPPVAQARKPTSLAVFNPLRSDLTERFPCGAVGLANQSTDDSENQWMNLGK